MYQNYSTPNAKKIGKANFLKLDQWSDDYSRWAAHVLPAIVIMFPGLVRLGTRHSMLLVLDRIFPGPMDKHIVLPGRVPGS